MQGTQFTIIDIQNSGSAVDIMIIEHFKRHFRSAVHILAETYKTIVYIGWGYSYFYVNLFCLA